MVQNGLQVAPGQVDLLQALLHRLSGVQKLGRHLRKRSRQTIQLIGAREHGSGTQVPRGHVSHSSNQPKQWTGQLIAQKNGQQHRPKHRQEQTQGECANVHPSQAFSGQGALVVLQIRRLQSQGIGHQGRRQALSNLQDLRVHDGGEPQIEIGGADQSQGFDLGLDLRTGQRILQALDHGQHRLAFKLSPLRRTGPVWADLVALPSSGGQRTHVRRPNDQLFGPQLFTQSL